MVNAEGIKQPRREASVQTVAPSAGGKGKGVHHAGRSPRSGVRGEGRFCEKRRPDECDPSPRIGTASRRWEIRNWDTFVVPKPFGRVVNVLGEPIDAGAISEGKELEKMLRDAMNEAQKEGDAWINREI